MFSNKKLFSYTELLKTLTSLIVVSKRFFHDTLANLNVLYCENLYSCLFKGHKYNLQNNKIKNILSEHDLN